MYGYNTHHHVRNTNRAIHNTIWRIDTVYVAADLEILDINSILNISMTIIIHLAFKHSYCAQIMSFHTRQGVMSSHDSRVCIVMADLESRE